MATLFYLPSLRLRRLRVSCFNLMNHYFKEAAKAIIFTSRSPNKSLKASYTLGLILYLRRH